MNPDWTEDFAHENGNYSCLCCRCGQAFVGHKRRVICKACFTESAAPTPAPDAADDLVALLGQAAKEYDEAVAHPPSHDSINDELMADVAMAHGHRFAKAAAAIVALRAEVARLKEALRELVECKDLGIAATRKLHEDAGSIQHGRIMNEEAKQMDAEYSRRIGPAWHAARAALEQP